MPDLLHRLILREHGTVCVESSSGKKTHRSNKKCLVVHDELVSRCVDLNPYSSRGRFKLPRCHGICGVSCRIRRLTYRHSDGSATLKKFSTILALNKLPSLTGDEYGILFQWLPAILQDGTDLLSADSAKVSQPFYLAQQQSLILIVVRHVFCCSCFIGLLVALVTFIVCGSMANLSTAADLMTW